MIHKEHQEYIEACKTGKIVKEKPILIELTLSQELNAKHPELQQCLDVHNKNVRVLKSANAGGTMDLLEKNLTLIGGLKLQSIPNLEAAKALASTGASGDPTSGKNPPPTSGKHQPPTFIVK